MSQKTIDSKNLAIEKIFEDFYVIPNYQREHIWNEKQVLELLNDVYNEFPNSPNTQSNEYFLGSIVVCPNSSDGDNVYEVIDGQQRLTTSYILFCVIKNYINQLEEHQSVDSIRRLIFANYTNTQGQDVSKYRVHPQYPDSHNILEKFSNDIADLEYLEKQNVYQTESVVNLILAYRTIESFIEEKFDVNENQIRLFYAHFIKKIKLVRVETADVNHALRVFETINNRGVGLDSMDLLKNLLFKQITKDNFQKISVKWKEVKDYLDKAQEKPINFLRYFILSQYNVERDDLQSKEYQWLQENNEICKYQEQPLAFVNKLLSVAKAYNNLLNQKNFDGSDNHNLVNIRYLIPNAKQHIILLLAGIDLSSDSFIMLTSEIENLLFVYTFLDKKINELEKPFIKWASEVAKISKNHEEKQEVQKFLNRTIIQIKKNFKNDFEQKFTDLSQLDFSSTRSSPKPNQNANKKTKYILSKLTQYIQILAYPNNVEYKKLKTFTQASVEIEHILPQALGSEIIDDFDKSDEIKSYIYKLGNLALLEKSLNSSIQNKKFKNKKNIYSHSKFLLTKAISEKPSIGLDTAIDKAVKELSSFDEWNSKSIQSRQEQLVSIAMKIWYSESFNSDKTEVS